MDRREYRIESGLPGLGRAASPSLDVADQGWIDHCVGTSLDTFKEALGRPCMSVRFGDRWLNTATVNMMEGLGLRFDLTIEPGLAASEAFVPELSVLGEATSFYRAPREPYEPSRQDFQRSAPSGTRAIRMIPMTSAHRRYGFGFLRTRLRRLLNNGFRGRKQDTPLWPMRMWAPPDSFDQLLERALAAQRRPYLAFCIRSDTGSSPRFTETVRTALRALVDCRAASRFVFCTPAEALTWLAATSRPGCRTGT